MWIQKPSASTWFSATSGHRRVRRVSFSLAYTEKKQSLRFCWQVVLHGNRVFQIDICFHTHRRSCSLQQCEGPTRAQFSRHRSIPVLRSIHMFWYRGNIVKEARDGHAELSCRLANDEPIRRISTTPSWALGLVDSKVNSTRWSKNLELRIFGATSCWPK